VVVGGEGEGDVVVVVAGQGAVEEAGEHLHA
jgi:hypothetical protein